MTQANSGSMRYRITLMAEAFTQGAGGRMTETSPIIADVWANMGELSSAKMERSDKQFLRGAVTFETWFQAAYEATRTIEFGPDRYKVRSMRKKGLLTPTIEFQATRI